MTRLGERIRKLIETDGPIGVDRYMALCLFDADDGYYTTREPFGAAGDFVTAPEVSQMFGEMVAIWLAQVWEALGRPTPITLAEIGPGRGTLMADMLRTLGQVAPRFVEACDIALIETSPRLAALQRERLVGSHHRIAWHHTVDDLPETALLIVGNELFDAIPVRQLIRAGSVWRERLVGIVGDDFAFVAGADEIPGALLDSVATEASDSTILEISPAREAVMAAIAARIAAHGGAGLFFDYGHIAPGLGDTLQAVRQHAYDSVFAHPGEADLTSHVDFHALAGQAKVHSLDVHLATQGAFLLAMGLLERAGALGARANEAARDTIHDAVERLAGPQAMGDLFKVLAIAPHGMAVPGFATSD